MDSENQQRYQTAPTPNPAAQTNPAQSSQNGSHNGNSSNGKAEAEITLSQNPTEEEILEYLHTGQLLMVDSRRRNGLILCKGFYAEFAGPGAAVGSFFDRDCQKVIAVGDLSLIPPENHEERQKAYLIRRQWIRLAHQFTEKPVSLQRAQLILNQFETYFDRDTISRIPDEVFASLVGVFPYTIRKARRKPSRLNVKVKASS